VKFYKVQKYKLNPNINFF